MLEMSRIVCNVNWAKKDRLHGMKLLRKYWNKVVSAEVTNNKRLRDKLE